MPQRVRGPLVLDSTGPGFLGLLDRCQGFPLGAHPGVSRCGRSGDLDDVYRHHGLDADNIVRAALGLTPDAVA